MKKLLFSFLALISIVGMTKAQDIYSTGYYTNSDGKRVAVVYKNDQKLYEQTYMDLDAYSSSIAVDPSTNDVYYVRNTDYGDIFRNDDILLNNPFSDTQINDIVFDNGDLIAGGYRTVGGVKVAVIWKNDDANPFYVLGDLANDSEVLSVDYKDGVVYAGGYQYVDGVKKGFVWVNDAAYYQYPDAEVRSITFSNQKFYYLVVTTSQNTIVFRDWYDVYTLGDESESAFGMNIKVDAGDIYVAGYRGSSDVCVWKNEELLYNHTLGEDAWMRAVSVNEEGVFYVGCDNNQHGIVCKNGEVLYSFDNCYLYDLYVTELPCSNESVRTLPYFEGFEMGTTDWTCWTVLDEGANSFNHNFMPFISCWQRWGVSYLEPATGNYFAAHFLNEDNDQEGWLISPRISLQARGEIKMTFSSYEEAYWKCRYEGVWVSTTDTNPASFTEVWNGVEQATDEWKQVEIDLSAYEGQTVYIAFKYAGLDGHYWFIDDINIVASATPIPHFTLTVSCNPTQGTVTGTGTYLAGSEVTVRAIPYDGYVFDRWNDGNTQNPRTVVVNNDMTLEALFKATSVNESGMTTLNVYPNPAKETLRIEGIEDNNEVVFYNSLGKMVKTVNASAEQDINISDLAPGFYMVRCGNQTLHFVKE